MIALFIFFGAFDFFAHHVERAASFATQAFRSVAILACSNRKIISKFSGLT